MSTSVIVAIVLGGLFVVWVLLESKTSRPDGELLKVHPYRRLMPYIMPGRNESVVYFDAYADATELLKYVEDANGEFGAGLTHCVVYAGAIGLDENPPMNRFVAGRRLYQRYGRWLTFSMKRKKKDKKAKLSAVKMQVTDDMSFRDFCDKVNAQINVERSGKKTYADKEFQLFNLLPRFLLVGAAAGLRWLDYYNILPAGFIEGDGMYTSMFVANLGSVGMDPGYHHLYEWGTCPLFLMIGKTHYRPMADADGNLVIKPVLHIRFSYDERIDDGLTASYGINSVVRVLENPYEELGCLTGTSSISAEAAARAADA